MKNEKSKSNRLAITVLVLLSAALVGWVVQSRMEISDLQTAQADLQKKFEAEAKRAKADAAAAASWRKQTDNLLGQAGEMQKEASGTAADKPASKRNLTSSEMATLMKNPAMQNIIGSQQAAIVQMTYRDLLDRFNLAPDERDYMQKLLIDKQMIKVNLGSQFLNPALTPEERMTLGQQFQQSMQGDEAKIHDFLNNDADYAAYQAYSQQEPERQEIGMFEASLANGSEPLSPAASDALANLMSATRKDFSFTVDFNDERNFGNPAVLNGPTVNKFLEEQTQFQAQLVEKAAAVLTPAQLEVFKQNQTAARQMTKAKLNSILQMSGAGQ